MSGSTALLHALRKMLPEAQIALADERPWHSSTFAGAQICYSIKLRDVNHARAAADFAEILAEHEFDLRRQLVADIGVADSIECESETQLRIDALVLED